YVTLVMLQDRAHGGCVAVCRCGNDRERQQIFRFPTSIANSWVEKPYFVSSRVAWATASNRESVILVVLLGEVKLLKGEVGGGLRELPNHRFHRHGGKLLRLLWERILVSTEAVLVSPRSEEHTSELQSRFD